MPISLHRKGDLQYTEDTYFDGDFLIGRNIVWPAFSSVRSTRSLPGVPELEPRSGWASDPTAGPPAGPTPGSVGGLRSCGLLPARPLSAPPRPLAWLTSRLPSSHEASLLY